MRLDASCFWAESAIRAWNRHTCLSHGFYRRSLTTYKGYLTHEETSAIQGKPWIKPEVILGIEGKHLDPAPPATNSKSTNYQKLERAEENDSN